MAPLTQAYIPKVIMTTCIYSCVCARDVFIHSVHARGKFIELLVRLTPKLHRRRGRNLQGHWSLPVWRCDCCPVENKEAVGRTGHGATD